MTEKPYKILKNATYGRFMAANRYIKQGELILKEKPVLVGPQIDGTLICFKCCRNVNYSGYIFCLNCKVAILCSPNCKGELHTVSECSTFKSLNLESDFLPNNAQVIFPLRCALIEKYHQEIFNKIMMLESHLEFRRNTSIWRRNKIAVEDILKGNKLLTENNLQDELVQKICGILDVNTFEIRPPHSENIMIISPESQCLRGFYLEAAMMAHNCMANVHLSVDDDFVLRIHASRDILENDPVYFNYANVLQGNIQRKEHLKEGKYFECTCQRCLDPTEYNTELSSLKCHKCFKGLIRRLPLQNTAKNWSCNNCKASFSDGLIRVTVDEGRRRIDDIENLNLSDMEKLLCKFQNTFHPNHYLNLELIQNIIGLYSQEHRNIKNLSRKIELCKQVLEVLSAIEPGISRLQALTEYQLQSALTELAHKKYRTGEIDEEELITQLSTCETILKKAVAALLYEPARSPEGRLVQTALKDLKQLRVNIKEIQANTVTGDCNGKTLVQLKNKLKQRRELKMCISDDDMNDLNRKMTENVLNIADQKPSRRRNRKKTSLFTRLNNK